MQTRPLGAQLSAMLAARGVNTVFGVPGVHNIELYRGIEQAGMRHVLARHEQGAGFMADGYARATGRPGVAYVITGPGLCNIMTPMGQAYSDSVPMLVVSSCLNPGDLGQGRGRLHEMKDQRAAAETVCDWSQVALTADAAWRLVDRAWREFQTQRARPKHIQVPIEVLGAPAGPAPAPTSITRPAATVPAATFAPILAAKRPLFIFGGGARGAAAAARKVLPRLGAAAFMTYAGRGIVAPDDPLNLGSYLGRPDSAAVIGSADVVVAVGTELSENDLWRSEVGHKGLMLRVDIDAAEMSDANSVNIQCDAGDFLRGLLAALDGHRPRTSWTEAEVAAARRRWRAETDAERPGVLPVVQALREALPPEALVYSDMTQFAYVAMEVWDMQAPGLWHHPSGFGTLGYALPAAIGGKLGRPEAPVIAIAGDYGLQYTIQELGTAAELGLPLPIILWDNGALKEIREAMEGSQIAPIGVTARNPDFGTLAAAYGVGYARPSSLDGIGPALRQALQGQGPTIIHLTPALSE